MGQGLEGGGGRDANVLLSGGIAISCNGGALRDSRSAGPMCVGGYPLLCGGCVCVGIAAKCARLRIMALGSAYTCYSCLNFDECCEGFGGQSGEGVLPYSENLVVSGWYCFKFY